MTEQIESTGQENEENEAFAQDRQDVAHVLNTYPFCRFRFTVELNDAVRPAVVEAAHLILPTAEDLYQDWPEKTDWMHGLLHRDQQDAALSFESLKKHGYIQAGANGSDISADVGKAAAVLFEAGGAAVDESGGMVNAISDLLVEGTPSGLRLQVNQEENSEGDPVVLLGAIAVIRALQEYYNAPPVSFQWATGIEGGKVNVGAAFIEPGKPVLWLDCSNWLESEEKNALGRILRQSNSQLH